MYTWLFHESHALIIYIASAVAEIGQQQAVEVDESLFQDLEDLELTESTQT